MSGSKTSKFLPMYHQTEPEPILFFSEMFRSGSQNFFNTEEVEFDIERSGEQVAVVVQDLSTGYRMNAEDMFTNKSFKPPIYKEGVVLNSHDLLKRDAGQSPFSDNDFRASIIMRMMKGMRKVERKIRRSMEIQASQVMQTGKLTLTDENGVALYVLDFKPKTTHFPTASTSWATATAAQMRADLQSLSDVNRNDGQVNTEEFLFGDAAFEKFFDNSDNMARFDVRRADRGTLVQAKKRSDGGSYRGTLEIGTYSYDIWTYGGVYEHPQTNAMTRYLDKGNVIARSSNSRMDAVFGAVPNIGALLGNQANRVLPEFPTRFSNHAGGMDMFANIWLPADGEQIFGGVASRPLMIPTGIDTYSCLITGL